MDTDTKTTTIEVEKLNELQRKLKLTEKLKVVTNKVNSVNNVDEIFIKLKTDIMDIFDARRITIFGIDPVKNELYSKHIVGDEVKNIRVPMAMSSIAGYTAYTLETVNIDDVHNAASLAQVSPKLKFDSSWDKKSGFHTKQVLAAPIKFDSRLFGVIQIINKKNDTPFNKDDETNVNEISRILGIAFRNQARMLNSRFNSLVIQNVLSLEDLKRAMAMARELKKDVETILVENFKVPKKDILAALAQFYGCKYREYSDNVVIPRDLYRGLNLTYLKRSFWAPIAFSEDKATIAIDGLNDLKTTEIKSLIKAKEIEFVISLKEDILKFITLYERENTSSPEVKVSTSDILDEMGVQEESDEDEDGEYGGIDENAAAIVRLANQIIIEAYNKGASDIHIEPSKAKKRIDIRYRVDGVCARHLEIPYNHIGPLVSRFKIMSNLDISERRLPQDGKIKFLLRQKPIELRVATLPTVSGESVVMRILASSEPMPLEALTLSKRNYDELKLIAEKPYGILLVVGPTGSGKTTTLHSVLGYINTPERKIWTAEDPVEITQYGLGQVEVKPKIKFDFARAMRAFLRADPDVIMVGEMRDYETASTGIEASLTGHLVLSTLHTNSAPETITRLIDMGLDPFNFADALLGVLAQRLVRTLCKTCKKPYSPTKEEFLALAQEYGEDKFEELGITFSKDIVLYKSKGCDACNNTGYKGRMGLHELLIGSEEMQRLIQVKSKTEIIKVQAEKDGMTTLKQDGIEKIFKGFTDIAQIRRVTM